MKPVLATLTAVLVLTPASFACDSYAGDVHRAGLAMKAANNERLAIQTQFEDADYRRAEIRQQIDTQGNTPARQAELDAYRAAIRNAELAWSDRQPEWDAAEAELMTAVAAHEGACGATARTGVLMRELGLTLAD